MNRRAFISRLATLAFGAVASADNDLYKGIGGPFVGSGFTFSSKGKESYKLQDLMPTDTPSSFGKKLNIHFCFDSGAGGFYRRNLVQIKERMNVFYAKHGLSVEFFEDEKLFKGFDNFGDFGVEILKDEKSFKERKYKLTGKRATLEEHAGASSPKQRVVIVRGDVFETVSFRQTPIKGIMAAACLNVHEIFHTAGLFHPDLFIYSPIEENVDGLRNVMLSFGADKYPIVTSDSAIGADVTPRQINQFFEYLTGRESKNYKALKECGFDLSLLVQRIADVNKLERRKLK